MINRRFNDYKNITQEWIKKSVPNSHEVLDMNCFKHNGTKYMVDNKNVILNYSQKEKDVAKWLKNTFGGEIYMVPKINNPEGISTPDYIFMKENWNLKNIKGNGKRTIDSAIKNKKKQSHNFIFDISESKLSEEELIKQVKQIYSTSGQEWVNKIIIKKNNQLLVVYKRS